MKISVLTIFPEMFRGFEEEPVIRRAILKGAVQIEYIDVRPFAGGSFRHIDDSTFGGGAGMVLRCAPVLKALETVRESGSFTAALTPAGEKYDQLMARELAQRDSLSAMSISMKRLRSPVQNSAMRPCLSLTS